MNIQTQFQAPVPNGTAHPDRWARQRLINLVLSALKVYSIYLHNVNLYYIIDETKPATSWYFILFSVLNKTNFVTQLHYMYEGATSSLLVINGVFPLTSANFSTKCQRHSIWCPVSSLNSANDGYIN